MKEFTDLDLAKRFHGHMGPNLVIGMKMGNYAVKALNINDHFGINVEVHCPGKPPVSCMIDGIQLATGATMGKTNIKHIISDEIVKVIFKNTQTGTAVVLTPTDSIGPKSLEWYNEVGEDEASLRVWKLPDDQVFAVCKSK
ncbi:formylmethanofuran dehydrogenase subunit E family protein [bacterium]|nr:formylmethanofuran dehydrogenase subunit E family protein [bacterium]